jgi:hypothetical protein
MGLCVSEGFKVNDGEEVQFTFHEQVRLAQNVFCSCNNVEDECQTYSHQV